MGLAAAVTLVPRGELSLQAAGTRLPKSTGAKRSVWLRSRTGILEKWGKSD